MKPIIKRLIEKELCNLGDNLYRYKMLQRAKPDWMSGNGEPIGEIIASLEASIAELKAEL